LKRAGPKSVACGSSRATRGPPVTDEQEHDGLRSRVRRFVSQNQVDRNQSTQTKIHPDGIPTLLSNKLLTGVGVSSRIRSLLAKNNNRPSFFSKSSQLPALCCVGGPCQLQWQTSLSKRGPASARPGEGAPLQRPDRGKESRGRQPWKPSERQQCAASR